MPTDDRQPDRYAEDESRKQRLKELARQFRDGSDVPIEAGVNVNVRSAAGYSLLLSAGIQRQTEIVSVLRQAGAKVGLCEAALLGEVDILRSLLDGGADVNSRHENDGYTALNWAAAQGQTEAVRLLLERGADAKSTGKQGFTPLLSSAVRHHSDVVALLTEAGAAEGVVEAALRDDRQSLVHLLDAGADIESENSAGMTPVMAAAACGHTICIRLLLDRGAALHKVTRIHSALTWAISYDRPDAVHLLLDRGADVNAADQSESEYLRGRTPISIAISHRLPEMTRLLIERGARVDVRDAKAQTPLHWAASACDPDVMRVLLDAGADINAVGMLQRTPLMSVADHILVKQDEHLSCVRLLLQRGADVNARAEHGETALMMAAGRGHTDIVNLLLDGGADRDARGNYGTTALGLAGYEGHAEVAALLRKRGAGVKRIEDVLGALLFGHKGVLRTVLLPRLWKRKRPAP